MTNDVEHLFMSLLVICVFFGELSIQIIGPFLYWTAFLWKFSQFITHYRHESFVIYTMYNYFPPFCGLSVHFYESVP